MSDKQYGTVAGIIQFPVTEHEVNGKQIRRATVRALGSGKSVQITVWDQYAAVPLEKGDFIVVDGQVSQNVSQKADGTPVTYNNISASTLVVVAQAQGVETTRTVNNSPAAGGGADDVSNLF